MNTIRKMVEYLFWLRIIASPLILGSVIGAIVYFNNPGTMSLTVGIALAVLGLIVGFIWAKRVSKKEGVIDFVSKVNASPDLNKN